MKYWTPLFVCEFLAVGFMTSFVFAQQPMVVQKLNASSLVFNQNAGQWADSILFRACANGATMWFTKDGIYYQFVQSPSREKPPLSEYGVNNCTNLNEFDAPKRPKPIFQGAVNDRLWDGFKTEMTKVSFVGADKNSRLEGQLIENHRSNYFLNNDPFRWRVNVPNYRMVIAEGLYEGIDLKYYGYGNEIEYDFVIAPGADYSRIQIQYDGANNISVNEKGELIIVNDWGTLIGLTPTVYQIDKGARRPIRGGYCKTGTDTYSFQLDQEYDPALPIIIAPVLIFSSYLGGGDGDDALSIAVDGLGCIYMTGKTASSDFPVQNPLDGSNNGDYDVFITKMSPAGDGLVYSTYLGGELADAGFGITFDDMGCAYVTGWTKSSDFPTWNSYDSIHNGVWDAFVVRLAPAGDSLEYCTLLGGNSNDFGEAIAVDDMGSIYIVGWTWSTDFPTQTAFDDSHNGAYDAFVTKLSAEGDRLIFSTYLGGENDDEGTAIAVDSNGCVYIGGSTYSSNFPIRNEFQSNLNGDVDVFIAKLLPTGRYLDYSTFLGGQADERGEGIAIDHLGNAYITGYTESPDFPTRNPFDGILGGGSDAFVTKLSAVGNSLTFSTFIGGSQGDEGNSIAVDQSGCVYLTGESSSSDFPTQNPFVPNYMGNYDAIVCRLSATGDSLIYSTYLGGSGYDVGEFISLDSIGCAYVTGFTYSSDFPIQDPYDSSYHGKGDVFFTKLCFAATDVDGTNEETIAPNDFRISQNYPNPFNPLTTIEYTTSKRSRVTIEIFNSLGQKVKTLVDQITNAGKHQTVWDGTDADGSPVSTGLYLYRLSADGYITTKKMVLLK